jgi:hypothetical protein
MLRILHCLSIRHTDDGKSASPTHRLHFIAQKHYFSAFGNHFFYRLREPQGLVRQEGLLRGWRRILLQSAQEHGDSAVCGLFT